MNTILLLITAYAALWIILYLVELVKDWAKDVDNHH